MSRLKPQDLNVGDLFVEHDSFAGSVTCRVTEKPLKKGTAMARDQWEWKAVNVDTGVEIEYLLTEGFEHYGPRIYSVSSVLIPRKLKKETSL